MFLASDRLFDVLASFFCARAFVPAAVVERYSCLREQGTYGSAKRTDRSAMAAACASAGPPPERRAPPAGAGARADPTQDEPASTRCRRYARRNAVLSSARVSAAT